MGEIVSLSDERADRLVSDLKGNIDAEPDIRAVTDLFQTDGEFLALLIQLPPSRQEEVRVYGRRRLRALGWPSRPHHHEEARP